MRAPGRRSYPEIVALPIGFPGNQDQNPREMVSEDTNAKGERAPCLRDPDLKTQKDMTTLFLGVGPATGYRWILSAPGFLLFLMAETSRDALARGARNFRQARLGDLAPYGTRGRGGGFFVAKICHPSMSRTNACAELSRARPVSPSPRKTR